MKDQRTLTWTTEPPTQDGYYWWMCDQEQPDIPIMTLATLDSAGNLGSFFVFGTEPWFHSCPKCRWAKVPTPE